MARRRILFTQRVIDVTGRDERRDALDQRWAGIASALDAIPIALPNRIDPVAYIDAIGPALIVLTGGNDIATLPGATDTAPERDAAEATLLDHAVATGTPVLGVCRGLQMVVHHFGGALQRADGHVGQPHRVTTVDGGRAPWPLATERVVNSFHDWAISEVNWPSELEVLARADDGTVEAAAHRRHPIVAIMWHPERPPADGADLALMRALMEKEL